MVDKKRILLIGHNFSPEPTGIGKYSGEMMEWLAQNGYDCTVVTTYPHYPYWKVQKPYKNGWYKKEVFTYPESVGSLTVYRCPLYVPENPTGKSRMLQDISFWSSKFWMILKLMLFKPKHDFIITVAPPFHLGYLAWFYRKLKGGKLIYHIQDLQIEAAQELKILSSDKLFEILYNAEKVLLKSSDFVSSISSGMIDKIKRKVNRDVLFFPNWVDTSYFFPIAERNTLKQNWGYNPNQLICLYSGSIGEKQGLENIILAADILKDDKDIHFIICGTGPYKSKLQELASSKNLTNVEFLPLQDKEKFNDFLNMADLHLIIQKANASDLVMPSKLSTILAVGGVSVVTAPKGTSLHKLLEQFEVGFIVEPDDVVKLAEAIAAIKQEDISGKRIAAREYALQYLNIDNVMNKFIEDIS
ncbi:colanic acid biosynthesis glycosyl transferase WcaI [Mucilaginibacter gracilis]|uniref:Colanic acid biosynthesis glycosyl transferase WcaI n=1 Tax=Mucilaginibacter gracilis TaxID=423350 RepID=A0A495IZW6_9SPHI|nr:WcaI family glycosyltransferase [Mucilaginibacter gracilis]RKR82265.1 colanic acid biosynthesis glycosyl transferase WcaI [Mucilaginibacter gracilis]